MTKKYTNMWDVTVRDSQLEEYVLRVESQNQPEQVGGYLVFSNTAPHTVTAMFPHQNVSAVVRVEEEPIVLTVSKISDEEISAEKVPEGAACVSSKCGCR